MSIMRDLGPAADAVTDVVNGISPSDLASSTPCGDYTVATLLEHVRGLSIAFADAAAKMASPLTDNPPAPSGEDLPDDWAEQLPDRLQALAEAWRMPDAWLGFTRVGGVDLPGGIAGLVALNELVVHGWDLAVATGQEYSLDDETLGGSLTLLYPPEPQSEREGVYGPVVEVPPDAPALDRVLGLAGRDPKWTP
ncbi:TIGR03086 family metal-binding protein [Stackebrandtia soli]|uniref:TIGR03086 family metal-binding protein n=1 Tax=Stackebrandtia soli TaxID=1892856 RepID=UPI0039EA2C73